MDAFYEAIGILLFAFASTDAPLQLRFHDAIHFRSFMTLGPAHQFFVKNYFFLHQMAFLEIIRHLRKNGRAFGGKNVEFMMLIAYHHLIQTICIPAVSV